MHTNPATSHMFIVNPLSGLHFCLKVLSQAKRLIIAVIGFTVLLTGIAMIVLPGPAFIL